MTMKFEPTKIISALAAVILFSTTVNAQEMKTYKASEIKPYQSTEIKPYHAKETKQVADNNSKNDRPGVNALQSFFGLYQYWVPGTSYTVADYSNRQLVLHNSTGTGVLPGGIKINADGTYVWNSNWDGKVIKGHWKITGNRDYPIELEKAQQGRNWKIGSSNDKGVDIVVWDGFTWYDGKKLKQ
jgi:hypothetical protein